MSMNASERRRLTVRHACGCVVLLAAAAALSGCPSSLTVGGGAGGGVRILSIDRVTGPTGTTLTVAVQINNATGVAGGDIRVTFDAGRVTAVGATTTGLTSGFQLAANPQPGMLLVSFANATAIPSGSGALIVLQLRLASTVASGACVPLVLRTDTLLFDALGQVIPSEPEDGELCAQ